MIASLNGRLALAFSGSTLAISARIFSSLRKLGSISPINPRALRSVGIYTGLAPVITKALL